MPHHLKFLNYMPTYSPCKNIYIIKYVKSNPTKLIRKPIISNITCQKKNTFKFLINRISMNKWIVEYKAT